MTTTVTAEPVGGAPAQIEWNLADIYDSLDAWRVDKARLEKQVAELSRFKGRLGESAALLSEALDANQHDREGPRTASTCSRS